MNSSVYSKLVELVRPQAQNGAILDCAIGERCFAVSTSYGTGLSFVTDAAWNMVRKKGVRQVEDEIRAFPLVSLIECYLGNDPLLVNLSLAGINSFLSCQGDAKPLDLNGTLRSKKKLGMVGYFWPLIDMIASSGVERIIFELREMEGTHRPEEAAEIMPQCDLIIITGATFANKTIHTYLPHISSQAEAFLLGHTAPLADFLLSTFSIGGTVVTNPETLFTGIRNNQGIRELKSSTKKVVRWRKT